ncbi:MAG: orotate phosphoribosyltransferase [Myxococcales bacterium]|nr:orotate phosphoribosyltransferase [Myxococcales bacterium]
MSPGAPTRERLRSLLRTLSLIRGDITLASGAQSGVYIDSKQTSLHPEGAAALGALLLDAVLAIEARTGRRAVGVGGMSIGADPLATAVSLTAWARGRALPAFLVRKTPKGHGTEAYLEGMANLPAGSPVVLLEDVVTTGGSTLSAAKRARAEGLDPFGVACIVDRQVGGVAALAADGLDVEALFALDELADDTP